MANSLEYKNLQTQEFQSSGFIRVWESSVHVQVFAPFSQSDDLSGLQAIKIVRGKRSLSEFSDTRCLVIGKPKYSDSRRDNPFIVGWIREVRPVETGWGSPWQTTLGGLPEYNNKSFSVRLIVVAEAVNSAKVTPALSGDFYARQRFKIQNIIYGSKEIAKNIELRYSYMEFLEGRRVIKGERVVWVLTNSFGYPTPAGVMSTRDQLDGYAGISDAPQHRQEAKDLAEQLTRKQ
jgi:hypothetical protein